MTIFDYIKCYGEFSFQEMQFNEVDNVIFSCLAYVDFSGVVSSSNLKRRLEDVATHYFSLRTKKENRQNIDEIRNGIRVLSAIWHTKRYRDVLLFGYFYVGTIESQFCALSLEYLKHHVYVAFEGTDELMSGWEEDFKIAYQFPVLAQKYVSIYLKKHYLFSFYRLILGGHSKGGHLAVVGLMEAPLFLRNRIDLVYSNDGLGLRKEEFNSKKYQRIQSKVVQIIPDYSIIGLLLSHHKNFLVVKSKSRGFFAHNPKNWLVEEDHFLSSNLSKFSLVFEQGILKWSSSYTKEEKQAFFQSVFDFARKHKIISLLDFKKKKFQLLRVIMASRRIDKKTKKMAQNLFTILIHCNKEYKTF